jgi:hypothetical protein
MIVVRQKPLADVFAGVGDAASVLVVGCNTCAAVCLEGGEKEADIVARAMRFTDAREGGSRTIRASVVTRQCEPEFLDELDLTGVDAVVSLGCGAGVALFSERVRIPITPGADTLFIGAARGLAAWRAECSACGSCVLGETAGICPVTRCAKGIMNGPCGGCEDGMCEVAGRTCAWALIHERLDEREASALAIKAHPPRDHSITTLSPEHAQAGASTCEDGGGAR